MNGDAGQEPLSWLLTGIFTYGLLNILRYYPIFAVQYPDPMKLLLLCLPLCFCLNVFSQVSKTTVDSLELRYEHCLGEGNNVYNCALQYYSQMDSLLNTVYRQLYSKLDNNRRESLQVSQQRWVEKKEAYFRNIEERADKKRPLTLPGLNDDMIVTDNKAEFLKNRVVELLANVPS